MTTHAQPDHAQPDLVAAVRRIREGLPVLTPRCMLRPLTWEDVDPVWSYRRLPEVARFLAHPPLDRAGAAELVDRLLTDPHQVTVVVEVDDRVVGDVRLFLRRSGAKAPAVTEEVEAGIGYAVHPAVQGQGLATEAARAVVDLAFAEGGVRRITSRVFTPAVASSRLLARIGFTHEGTERAAVLADDGTTWWDDEAWSLLREEWAASRAS